MIFHFIVRVLLFVGCFHFSLTESIAEPAECSPSQPECAKAQEQVNSMVRKMKIQMAFISDFELREALKAAPEDIIEHQLGALREKSLSTDEVLAMLHGISDAFEHTRSSGESFKNLDTRAAMLAYCDAVLDFVAATQGKVEEGTEVTAAEIAAAKTAISAKRAALGKEVKVPKARK